MSVYERIYTTVRHIPRGRVSSYGRVAALCGLPGQARLVGYALHALRTSTHNTDVPWWRVVNATGHISNAYEPELQRVLLAGEGVCFNQRDRIDLTRFLWEAEVLP